MIKVYFKKAPNGFLDYLIKLRTFSKYSHCELCFSDQVTWRVMAGDNPASHFLFQVPYDPNDWDVKNVMLTYAQEGIIRGWVNKQIGKAYDYVGILNFVIPLGEDDDDDLFCSESCIQGFQQIGWYPGINSRSIWPGRVFTMLP